MAVTVLLVLEEGAVPHCHVIEHPFAITVNRVEVCLPFPRLLRIETCLIARKHDRSHIVLISVVINIVPAPIREISITADPTFSAPVVYLPRFAQKETHLRALVLQKSPLRKDPLLALTTVALFQVYSHSSYHDNFFTGLVPLVSQTKPRSVDGSQGLVLVKFVAVQALSVPSVVPFNNFVIYCFPVVFITPNIQAI